MVASLIKTIYSGAEDVRLGVTKEPYIRLKKYINNILSERQGRATTQWIRLDFISPPEFGRKSSIILPRKGHFIRRLFLVTSLPDLDEDRRKALRAVTPRFGYTNSIGHALIDEATLTIGGAKIDTLNSRLLEVLDEAYTPLEKVPTINKLIGRSTTDFGDGLPAQQLHIPLPFWFCNENPAYSLPIDSIAVDEVRLEVTIRNLVNLYYTRSRTTDGALYPLDSPTYYAYNDISGQLYPNLYIPPIGEDPEQYTRQLFKAENSNGRPIDSYKLGDTYILAEYVYVDSPEANRYRLADLEIPIVQHTIIEPVTSQGRPEIQIPIRIGNPVKSIRFYGQLSQAEQLNSYFLATRELAAANQYGPSPQLWWPITGSFDEYNITSAFSNTNSELFSRIQLKYHGTLIRYTTDAPVQFRTCMPLMYGDSKTAWHNKYYYMLPFGDSCANYDKIERIQLELGLQPVRGKLSTAFVPPAVTVYLFAETVNILRIFGGRAGLLF